MRRIEPARRFLLIGYRTIPELCELHLAHPDSEDHLSGSQFPPAHGNDKSLAIEAAMVAPEVLGP